MDGPQLIGRERELDAIRKAVDARSSVIVEGPPGIGKTALWSAGVAAARDAGFVVLTAAPAEAEASMVFGVLADLLEGVAIGALAHLPGPQQRALAQALLLEDDEGMIDARAVAAGLLAALRSLAAERPVLVAVDDVQWVDRSSAEALAFALRRVPPPPVAVLLARRTATDTALPLGLERRDGRDPIQLVLAPLGLGDVQRLLHRRLDLMLPRPLLRRVLQHSGGNPLYALEVGRALVGQDLSNAATALPVSASLEALLQERVSALPAPTREVLLLAALAADPTVPQLEAATGTAVSVALRSAADVGVVELIGERVVFRHPLFAAAMQAGVSTTERRRAHARLAAAPGDDVATARHAALASPMRDPALAARLEDAGDESQRRGATAVAGELYLYAVDRTPSDDIAATGRRAVKAAQALLESGDIASAHAVTARVATELPPGTARARLVACQLRSMAFAPDLAEREAAAALTDLDGDHAATADVHLSLALVRGVAGDFTRSGAAAADAIASATAAHDPGLLAQAVAIRAITDVITGGADPHDYLPAGLAAENRAGMPVSYHTPSTMVGLAALLRDDLDTAAQVFSDRAVRAVERGDEQASAQLLLNLAEVELRAGDWSAALHHAQQCVDACANADLFQAGAFHYIRGLVQAHLGREDEARRDAEVALARSLAVNDAIFTAQSRWVLGFLEVSRGRHAEALGPLEQAAADLARAGERHSPLFGYRADLVEALVGVGRFDDAKRIAADLRGAATPGARRSLQLVALRCDGLVRSVTGDAEGAIALLEQAQDVADELGWPFERARTALTLGAALRRAGAKRRPREVLEAARLQFDCLGATLWVRRCADEGARVGGRAAAGPDLTPTEAQIAELAATGRTNAEIANALFVAVKTVEANLSRIYAKLGVRSRTQLAVALATGGGKPRVSPDVADRSGRKSPD